MILHEYLPDMARIFCWLTCALATLSVASMECSHVTMSTTLGKVRGHHVQGTGSEQDVNVYYGIPFAKPPLGHLRFRVSYLSLPWGRGSAMVNRVYSLHHF